MAVARRRFPGLRLMACCLLAAGCVAETVRKNQPRKGPVQEVGYVDTGGGEVRYSLDGWSWFVAGRRRDAWRRMRRICGTLKPLVTDEFSRQDADVSYSQEDIYVNLERGMEHYTVAPYNHIVFDCGLSTAPLPGPAASVVARSSVPLVEVFAPGAALSTAAVQSSTGMAPSAVPEVKSP
ncbi:MAG TPA: hypothetical protein DEB40_05025 [Elusimicrobia bacterium]|nr:hypothetical protein [Elusimicrobiota bacterium]HBT61086.1 hypothetical protein [Elusimicrobiota bacterium]